MTQTELLIKMIEENNILDIEKIKQNYKDDLSFMRRHLGIRLKNLHTYVMYIVMNETNCSRYMANKVANYYNL